MKVRQALRFLLAGAIALALAGCEPRKPAPDADEAAVPQSPRPGDGPPQQGPPVPGCGAIAADPASAGNAQTADTLAWRPFGLAETGWRTYAPRIAREIGVDCPPESVAFADALRAWQGAHGLPGNGRMDEPTFLVMETRWELQRPFVRITRKGICPDPPAVVADATLEEGYLGKPVQARAGTLKAYRRMISAAREEAPRLFADPSALTIFSAYRSPEADAERCLLDANCDNVRRSTCSPHRTGLALDLYVGAAPGYGPDSSADPNRLHQSQTAIYRWLLANAGRFGFVNYPYEPWHWEWTGEAP